MQRAALGGQTELAQFLLDSGAEASWVPEVSKLLLPSNCSSTSSDSDSQIVRIRSGKHMDGPLWYTLRVAYLGHWNISFATAD